MTNSLDRVSAVFKDISKQFLQKSTLESQLEQLQSKLDKAEKEVLTQRLGYEKKINMLESMLQNSESQKIMDLELDFKKRTSELDEVHQKEIGELMDKMDAMQASFYNSKITSEKMDLVGKTLAEKNGLIKELKEIGDMNKAKLKKKENELNHMCKMIKNYQKAMEQYSLRELKRKQQNIKS